MTDKPKFPTKDIAAIIVKALADNGITATTGQFAFTPRWIHADLPDTADQRGSWSITITPDGI
jgi:hypothetical protein